MKGGVKNILVVTYWPLDSALISTYTVPYLRIIRKCLPEGSTVFLFTLSSGASRRSGNLKIISDSLAKENIVVTDHEYSPFSLRMIIRSGYIFTSLLRLCSREKISGIHAWCTPGGAIGYLLSVLTGRPLVVDSFEPHAETMIETGTWHKGSFAYRLLLYLEKKQLIRAREVICAAEGMIAHSQEFYGVKKARYFVKPACVDLALFTLSHSKTVVTGVPPASVVCVYAGKFGGIYLEEELFRFFKIANDHWKNNFRVMLLTSESEEVITEYCRLAGFPREHVIKNFLPHHEIPQWMSAADFAICPVKPVPTKKYCTPIKNGEYWALGLPVVITKDISDDSDIIARNNAGYVLQSLSTSEYKTAVTAIDGLLKDSGHRIRIRTLAERYRNFKIAEELYRAVYA